MKRLWKMTMCSVLGLSMLSVSLRTYAQEVIPAHESQESDVQEKTTTPGFPAAGPVSMPRPTFQPPRPSFSAPRPSFSPPRPSVSAPRPTASVTRSSINQGPTHSAVRPSTAQHSAPRMPARPAPQASHSAVGQHQPAPRPPVAIAHQNPAPIHAGSAMPTHTLAGSGTSGVPHHTVPAHSSPTASGGFHSAPQGSHSTVVQHQPAPRPPVASAHQNPAPIHAGSAVPPRTLAGSGASGAAHHAITGHSNPTASGGPRSAPQIAHVTHAVGAGQTAPVPHTVVRTQQNSRGFSNGSARMLTGVTGGAVPAGSPQPGLTGNSLQDFYGGSYQQMFAAQNAAFAQQMAQQANAYNGPVLSQGGNYQYQGPNPAQQIANGVSFGGVQLTGNVAGVGGTLNSQSGASVGYGRVSAGADGVSVSQDFNGPPVAGVPTMGSVSYNPVTGAAEVCYGPGFTIPSGIPGQPLASMAAQICFDAGGSPPVAAPAVSTPAYSGQVLSAPSGTSSAFSPSFFNDDSDDQ